MLCLLRRLAVTLPAVLQRRLQLLQLLLTFRKQTSRRTAACPLMQALLFLALQRFFAFELCV
ncbi:hypothetical protein D3C81_2257040 [compost metagenome]